MSKLSLFRLPTQLAIGLSVIALVLAAVIPWVLSQGVTQRNFGSIHLILGNPSGATKDGSDPDNLLLIKPQYALSYNRRQSIPNWVSWQLNSRWLGSEKRCKTPQGEDNFQPDSSLPQGFKPVLPTDYRGSGFDRGHMTPSADRTDNRTDNCATFLMTNIIPQSPDVNQGPWARLENYSRELVEQDGKELFIIAGGAGSGGEGSNGSQTRFAGRSSRNAITVPASSWKVIVVLERPGARLPGITQTTRTIAVIMPQKQGVKSEFWDVKTGDQFKYITSVDAIEKLTGYDFLTNVPKDVQDIIEGKVDSGS